MTAHKLHGLHDMTNTAYHAAPGISSSKLRLLKESPLHLFHDYLFKQEPSVSKSLGSLTHSLSLEPHKTDNEFVVMPKFDVRTIDGKTAKKEWLEDNINKTVVELDDYEKAKRMAFNVLAISGNLLKLGGKEQSYFAEDNGLLLKCRPDNYIEANGIVVDIKTTSDISSFGMRKSIANYRYDWSAVFYMKVLETLGLPAKKFVFVFVDSNAPHMVKVRELSSESLKKAASEVDAMLDSYREYLASGKAKVIHELTPFGE